MKAITENSVQEEEQTPLVLQSSDHEEGKKKTLILYHALFMIWICPEKDEPLNDDNIRLLPEDYEITENLEMVKALAAFIRIAVIMLLRVSIKF